MSMYLSVLLKTLEIEMTQTCEYIPGIVKVLPALYVEAKPKQEDGVDLGRHREWICPCGNSRGGMKYLMHGVLK